jgi:hypothetical protein
MISSLVHRESSCNGKISLTHPGAELLLLAWCPPLIKGIKGFLGVVDFLLPEESFVAQLGLAAAPTVVNTRVAAIESFILMDRKWRRCLLGVLCSCDFGKCDHLVWSRKTRNSRIKNIKPEPCEPLMMMMM